MDLVIDWQNDHFHRLQNLIMLYTKNIFRQAKQTKEKTKTIKKYKWLFLVIINRKMLHCKVFVRLFINYLENFFFSHIWF